jgi:hypothetical protein
LKIANLVRTSFGVQVVRWGLAITAFSGLFQSMFCLWHLYQILKNLNKYYVAGASKTPAEFVLEHSAYRMVGIQLIDVFLIIGSYFG